MFRLGLVLILLVAVLPIDVRADDGFYPILADDGQVIANHRVSSELESQIDKLPGIVVAGNPQGSITLTEFYDVNCPFCRAASPHIDRLLQANRDLRLVLVPFPVLGVPSIQATRVELAVAQLASAQRFYAFHRALDQVRGTVDGTRALQAAREQGLEKTKVLAGVNGDLAEVMKSHLKLGDALGIQATPGFVIKGVAIVGYPGPKALTRIVTAVAKCGAVFCKAE